MSRLFAIGDIHGCDIALRSLLQHLSLQPADIVVTLGDYVDRGPNSCGVIDQLIALGQRCQLVGILGNHEEMMLDVLDGRQPHHSWLRYGGVETLESYGFDGDLDFLPDHHRHFFSQLGDFFEYEDFIFTHASYDPRLPFENQSPQLLRWTSLDAGEPEPHSSGKTVVVGHTANAEGEVLDRGHLIRTDTYCYGGGWLSAVELRSREVYQANQRGEVRVVNQPAG